MSAVQGSVTEGDEGGPVLDGLPSCSWSYAGGGTNWYTDVSLPSDFEVRLTVTDFEGNSVTTIPQWVDVSSVCGSNLTQNPADILEIRSATLIPERFAFDAPAPNPFSSQTRFRFSLPAATQVDIRIFDVLGREVSTVLSEVRGAGIHEESFLGDNLPNGTYIVRLRAGTDVASRIIIVRR